MAVQYSTLRPGLLVSLKTSVQGNVSYAKRTIEADHVTPTGAKLEVWETERRVAAPEEHERACKARNAAGSVIRSVCSTTAFGLLCPEDKAAQLEEAIGRAREIAAEFNATATVSQLGVYVITGRVAQDDVEAVRAIKSEVRELMESMQNGIKTLDVKAVRAAAIKARSIGQMLSDDASDKIKVAIDLARKSANAIAKVGEGVSQEIDLETVKKIEQQRVAFLDLTGDDHDGITAVSPAAAARAVDFGPDSEPEGDPEAEYAAWVSGQMADEQKTDA
jgi:outer membrane receptor protein involved in Fe transport